MYLPLVPLSGSPYSVPEEALSKLLASLLVVVGIRTVSLRTLFRERREARGGTHAVDERNRLEKKPQNVDNGKGTVVNIELLYWPGDWHIESDLVDYE